MNPQISSLLQLFAVLVVTASTESSTDPDHLLCSKTCNPLHHQVVYEPGQTYIYSVKLKTKIADQANVHLKKKLLKITALADISVYTQCEFVLRLREVAVVTGAEEDEDNRLRQLEQSLEAASTHFAYEDGKVISICGHEKMVDDKWVVDIKKTIISSLQMTSSDVAQKQSLMETDISGYCETLYSPLKSNNTKIIAIKKSKRMRKCAQQHQLNNSFYQTIFSSLLVDNSAIECTQMLEDQIIISVSCLSRQRFGHFAIKVSSRINVSLIEKKPTLDVPKIEGQLISYPLIMSFKSSDHYHHHDVKQLLKQICSSVQNSIQLDVPEAFYELTQLVNSLNVPEEAAQLWEQIKSGQLCSSPKLTDLFLDALASAGNEASAEVLIRAYQKQQISQHQATHLFGLLGFAKNATVEAAQRLVDFVMQQKQELVNVPRGIIFGITGYLHNLQIIQQHNQNSKISDIVKLMEDTLVNAIQKHQQQQAALPLVYALQNLFTTQRTPNQPQIAPKIIEILKQIPVSQANQELRFALVKTVAKTLPPLDDDHICQFLTDLVVNEESIHVQIEAYKAVALTSCAAQSKLLQQIKQFTEQVATQPELVNYIRSHQNNLRATSDGHSEENLFLPVFGKPSDQYFGISRNYKLPYASKALDRTITTDADIIYGPAASNQFVRIPQTVSFNLNIPIDDGQKQGHQLIEVRLHQQGLESVIAHLLHDDKCSKCSNGLWKVVKATLLSVLQSSSEVLGSRLLLQIAVDGKTVLLLTERDLMSTGHVQEQLMAALKQPQIYLDRAFAISPLDTVLQLPSLGGVPIGLRVNSTIILGLKTDLNLNLTNSNIRLAVYPSLASQLETSVEFQVGPENTRSLVWAQNAYIAPFVDMQAEVTKGRLISFKVNLPDEKKYTVAQLKSQVYTRGQRAQVVSSKAIANQGSPENPNCTMITKDALGVIFCYSNFSEITLVKTDPKIRSYEITLELPYTIDELLAWDLDLGKQGPFKFRFNTPGSQINRKIALEIELPKTTSGRRIKKAHFLLQIPWRRINAVMTVGRNENDMAHIEFSIDNHKVGQMKLKNIQKRNSTSTQMIVAVAGFEAAVSVTSVFSSNQQMSLKITSDYKLPSWKQQEQIMVDFDVQKYYSNEKILRLVNSGTGKMSQFPEYKVKFTQDLMNKFGKRFKYDLNLGWEATTDDQLSLYTSIRRTERKEGKMDINSHFTAIYTPLNINYNISGNATIAEQNGQKYGQILVDGTSIDLKTDVAKKIFNLSGQYSPENASIEASLIDRHGVPYTHKTIVIAELDQSGQWPKWTFPKSISLQSSTRKNAQPFVQIQANLSKQFNLSSSLLHIQAADNFDFHLQLTPYDDTMKSGKMNDSCFNGKFSGYDEIFEGNSFQPSAYKTDEWKSLFPSANLVNSDLTNTSNSINYQLELQISAMLFNDPIKHCTLLHLINSESSKPILHLETQSYRPQTIPSRPAYSYYPGQEPPPFVPIDDETRRKMQDRIIYFINATYYHAEPEKPLWVKIIFGRDVHAKLDVALFNPEKLVISLISDRIGYKSMFENFLHQTSIQFYYKPQYRLTVHSKTREKYLSPTEEVHFNLSSNYCFLSSTSYRSISSFMSYYPILYKYQLELDGQSSQGRLELFNKTDDRLFTHRTYFAIKNNSSYQLKTSTVKSYKNIFAFEGNLRPASDESNLRIKVGHDTQSYSSDISIHPEVNFHRVTLRTLNLQHDSKIQLKDDLDGLGNYVLFKTSTRYEDVLLAAVEARIGGKTTIELALLRFTMKANFNAHSNQHQLTTITPAFDEQAQLFYFNFTWNINDQSEDAVISFEIDVKTIKEESVLQQVTLIKAVFNQQQLLLKVTFLPNQELLLNNHITLLVAMDSLKMGTEMHKSVALEYQPSVFKENPCFLLVLTINEKYIFKTQLRLVYSDVNGTQSISPDPQMKGSPPQEIRLEYTDTYYLNNLLFLYTYITNKQLSVSDEIPTFWFVVDGYDGKQQLNSSKRSVPQSKNASSADISSDGVLFLKGYYKKNLVMTGEYREQLPGQWTAVGSAVDLTGRKFTNFNIQSGQLNETARNFTIKLTPWKNDLELSKVSIDIKGIYQLTPKSFTFEHQLQIKDVPERREYFNSLTSEQQRQIVYFQPKLMYFNSYISTQTNPKTGFTTTLRLHSNLFTSSSKMLQLTIKPSTEMVPLDGQLKIYLGPSWNDILKLTTAIRLQPSPKTNYTFEFTAVNEDERKLYVEIRGAASESNANLMWKNYIKDESGSYNFSFSRTDNHDVQFEFNSPSQEHLIAGDSEYSDIEGPFGTTSKYTNNLLTQSRIKNNQNLDYNEYDLYQNEYKFSSFRFITQSVDRCIYTTTWMSNEGTYICPKLDKATNTVGINVNSSYDNAAGNLFNATFQRAPAKRSLNLQYSIEPDQLKQSIASIIDFNQPSIQALLDVLDQIYIRLTQVDDRSNKYFYDYVGYPLTTYALSELKDFRSNIFRIDDMKYSEKEENIFWMLILEYCSSTTEQLEKLQKQCNQSVVCKNPFNYLRDLFSEAAKEHLEQLMVKNHNFTIISSGKLFQFDPSIKEKDFFGRFLENVQIIVQELFREAHYSSFDLEHFEDAAEQSAKMLWHQSDLRYVLNRFYWNATKRAVGVNLCTADSLDSC